MDTRVLQSLSTEQIHEALLNAKDRYEVRSLVDLQGFDRVNKAWKRLDPLTKATLTLAKEFDGRIIS